MPSVRPMPASVNRLLYVLLALLMVGSALFYVTSSAAILDSLMNTQRARPPILYSNDARLLMMPEARRAGLQEMDQVLSVDGVPFTGTAGLIQQTFDAHPGQWVSVLFRRHSGGVRTTQLQLVAGRDAPATLTIWLVNILLDLIFPALCLLLGYWVVLAKPQDWNSWLVFGIMNVVPAFLGRSGYFPGFLTAFTVLWQIFSFQWLFVSLILFSIYFPVRSRVDIRYPWLKWLLVIPQIPIVPANMAIEFGVMYHLDRVLPYFGATKPLEIAGSVFAVTSVLVYIAAIISRLFTVTAKDARRRLGVLAAGSLLGLTPVLSLLVAVAVSQKSLFDLGPPWALFAVAILFAFFPISLAYTLIVQRAMDLRIILRQGTRYAFARGTLWVLQGIVFIFLGVRLIHFVSTSGRFAQLIAPVIFVIVVLFLRLRIARPLSEWIDRRFFREAYSVEQLLIELSEQARTFRETEPLLRTITERISETLHVKRISFLLREGSLFHLQFAHGMPLAPDVFLAENSSTVRALNIDRSPKRVYREQPDPWLALAAPTEVAVLDRLEAELLLPLPGRANLVGLMALGPKQSEEPYSRSDRQLLSSVALQAGLAIESNTLVHELAEESAGRQRIKREIEIAREVQERLLPQIYPVIPGVDFAGFSRTAQEVGGDYYDFIPLENGRLGIAIGDVSGKGISSALLMASIRAALHGLTFAGTLDLARLMQGLNRIIYDSSTSNRFVTFFFGEYDPVTRTLGYVNAGHNAPVILRRAQLGLHSDCNTQSPIETGTESCSVHRLPVGGPVVGIFNDVQYEQGCIQLQSCDALIAFTDGISEAMTAELEEWGEERLIEAVRDINHRSAQDIVKALVASADKFVAGAPQNDDLSVVVLRVL